MHEARYVKKLTMKAWEGHMVGYGKDSKTYRIWESGTKIAESRNVTFIEALPAELNAFDHDHNDGNDDTFLDLESSTSLVPKRCRKQKPIPNRTAVKARMGEQREASRRKVIMTSTRKGIAILTVDQAKRKKQNK